MNADRETNWLARHEAFVRDDDDSLPANAFPPYRDEEQSADWTLAQAIGWIHGRSAAWARRFAPEYLRLKPREPLLPLAPSDVIAALKSVASFEYLLSVKADLYHRLASGELVTQGREAGRSRPQDISQVDWRPDTVDDLDIHGGKHDDLGGVDGKDAYTYSKVTFNAVRVRRADVLRLWPAPVAINDVNFADTPEAEAQSKTPSPEYVESETSTSAIQPAVSKSRLRALKKKACETKLVAMMRASRHEARAQREVWPEFEGTVSWRGFRSAWTSAADKAEAPAWSAAGARRKRG